VRRLVIGGQIHSAGAQGPGVGVWVAEGAREASSTVLWRLSDGSAGDAAAMQELYDVSPGAAAWSVYEVTRLTAESTDLRADLAESHAYLVMGHALRAHGNDAAARQMYERAVLAAPDNFAARNARIITQDPDLESRDRLLDDLKRLLEDFAAANLSVLDSNIWLL
jgi:hypothetical protein